MLTIDLGGDDWTVTDLTTQEQLPATVPGCVHLDLIAAGKLPDLYYRDNELQYHWVCERDWEFRRRFTVDAGLLAHEQVCLRCAGLDTLATVSVNGTEVLSSDNMFRTYELDIKAQLTEGEGNEIVVRFASTLPVLAAGTERQQLPAWNCFHPDFDGKSYVRKMACSYGWDWGPMAPTAGIWRAITLEGRDAELADVHVRQQHGDGAVTLALSAAAEGGASLRWQLWRDGAKLAETSVAPGEAASLEVLDPELWWPNGMGAQPLYVVLCELLDAEGVVLDRERRRIGLRTVELVREVDEWGESFDFSVNGRRIFAKGANWIPADIFVPRLTRADYERLLGDAAAAHMNCIRCWGGGIYEEPAFYEVCDELGLLVWQDFMFACSTYPAHEQAFLDNVRLEAIDNVRRLRHHPSIFFWCGNNELEQGLANFNADEWTKTAMPGNLYKKLFDDLLGEVVAAEDPERAYWPCSPHTPVDDRRQFNDPASGDAHCWDVWFGGQPFEAQRKWLHRFMSEFGFQSFPEPKTCATFTEPDERNLTSYTMDYHQRSTNRGNKTIFAYLLDWFQVPKDYENTLWQTQLTHALCIQYAAEHARRMQPRMMGCVYWQLNDIWPAPTWASIDVFGRWKALQYLAKRFNEPVLVTGLEEPERKAVAVHVSNHQAESVDALVKWTVVTCSGEVVDQGTASASIPSQANRQLADIDLAEQLDQYGARDLIVFLSAEIDGEVVSRNHALFARPKHLKFQLPKIATEIEDGAIELSTDVPALWVRLELSEADNRFSDNYIHLLPGQPQRVEVLGGLSGAEIERQLSVTSVVDTWR